MNSKFANPRVLTAGLLATTFAAVAPQLSWAQYYDLAPPNPIVASDVSGLFRVPPPSGVMQSTFSSAALDPESNEERLIVYSLSASYNVDSNGNRTPDDSPDNKALTITPGIAYESRLAGRHPYKLYASASYTDQTLGGSTSQYLVGGEAAAAISDDIRVGGGLRVSHTTAGRGGPGARTDLKDDDRSDKTRNVQLGGQATWGREDAPVQVAVGVGYGSTEYLNNDLDNRNFDQVSYSASVFYNPTAITSLWVTYGQTTTSYENPGEIPLDSSASGFSLGASWKPSERLSVRGTYSPAGKREYDNIPTVGTVDTDTYHASVSYAMPEGGAINAYLGASVDDADPNVPDAVYGESTLVGISTTFPLTRRISVGGSYNKIDIDFNTGRTDTVDDFGLFAAYVINEFVAVGVSAGRNERNSSVPDGDYNNSFYTVYVSSQIQQR